jgi:IS30 family transposase
LATYRTLSPADKRDIIFALHVRDEMTQKAIADALDVAQSTVSRQLTKAGVLPAELASEGADRLRAMQRSHARTSRRSSAPAFHVRGAMERVQETLLPLSRSERQAVLVWASAHLLRDAPAVAAPS